MTGAVGRPLKFTFEFGLSQPPHMGPSFFLGTVSWYGFKGKPKGNQPFSGFTRRKYPHMLFLAELLSLVASVGCGSKPMVPFWGRGTAILVFFSGNWFTHGPLRENRGRCLSRPSRPSALRSSWAPFSSSSRWGAAWPRRPVAQWIPLPMFSTFLGGRVPIPLKSHQPKKDALFFSRPPGFYEKGSWALFRFSQVPAEVISCDLAALLLAESCGSWR